MVPKSSFEEMTALPYQARQVSGPASLSGRLNFTSALLLEKLRHSSQMIYSIFHTSSHVSNLSKKKITSNWALTSHPRPQLSSHSFLLSFPILKNARVLRALGATTLPSPRRLSIQTNHDYIDLSNDTFGKLGFREIFHSEEEAK